MKRQIWSHAAPILMAAVCAVTLSLTRTPSVNAAVQCGVYPNCGECQPCNGRCIDETSLCILEPLPGGTDEIKPSAQPLNAFLVYVNAGVWQWAFRVGVAIAVLNGVAGGFQIVLSNGDSSAVDKGKARFIGSAIGLIILLLSAAILSFLNPVGFQSA